MRDGTAVVRCRRGAPGGELAHAAGPGSRRRPAALARRRPGRARGGRAGGPRPLRRHRRPGAGRRRGVARPAGRRPVAVPGGRRRVAGQRDPAGARRGRGRGPRRPYQSASTAGGCRTSRRRACPASRGPSRRPRPGAAGRPAGTIWQLNGGTWVTLVRGAEPLPGTAPFYPSAEVHPVHRSAAGLPARDRPGQAGRMIGAMFGALADLVLPRTCAGWVPGRSSAPRCAVLLAVPRLATPRRFPWGFPPTVAAGAYAGPVRPAVNAFKERGRTELARPLGTALALAVAAVVSAVPRPSAGVVLVPVPSSRPALRTRGRDHVRADRRAVAELRAAGLPACQARLLRRRRGAVTRRACRRPPAGEPGGHLRADRDPVPGRSWCWSTTSSPAARRSPRPPPTLSAGRPSGRLPVLAAVVAATPRRPGRRDCATATCALSEAARERPAHDGSTVGTGRGTSVKRLHPSNREVTWRSLSVVARRGSGALPTARRGQGRSAGTLDTKLSRIDVELSTRRTHRQAANCQRVEITLRGKGPIVRAEAADPTSMRHSTSRRQARQPIAPCGRPPPGTPRPAHSASVGTSTAVEGTSAPRAPCTWTGSWPRVRTDRPRRAPARPGRAGEAPSRHAR